VATALKFHLRPARQDQNNRSNILARPNPKCRHKSQTKRTIRMNSRNLIGLIIACGLAGCGGGGNSSAPTAGTAQPSVLTGVLVDSAVQGIAYSTPTRSGTTDVAGRFEYLGGETVTFSLYGQTIGQAVGGPTLTPFNLQSPTNHPDFALNLIRLLQTMDSDADPANGITLPTVAGSMSINLDQPTTAFDSDPAVGSFIGTRTLVSASTAVAHLTGTIATSNPGYSVNLVGRTATSRVSFDFCPGASLGITYSFAASSYTRTFDDSAAICDGGTSALTPPPDITFTGAYSTFPDISIACGPTCSYADLNRIVVGQLRANGRTSNLVVHHVPGTKVITSVWTEMSGQDTLWLRREVLTLN
jgi:hypothetical protein